MESLLAWKRLQAVKGLGKRVISHLVLRFGSPEAVQSASLHELMTEGGVSHTLASRIHEKPSSQLLKEVKEETVSLEKGKYSIVTILDPLYPHRLKMIPDPPPVLYMTGNLKNSRHEALAIVGSRKGTHRGIAFTRKLSSHLAEMGFTIVSGLARGIDAAAHQGALDVKRPTVAVLGCGIDRTYPSEHTRLRHQIESHGAVLSEFPPGSPPLGHHFPERNRVISGISMGVIVTEASVPSGSLVTARLAAEQNREVFAVPGSVMNPMSRGPHLLIKQGAKLVEGPEDVLEELLPQLEGPHVYPNPGEKLPLPASSLKLEPKEEALFNCLSLDPASFEDVISQSSLDPAETVGLLLSLEIKGIVKQLPGARYIRVFSKKDEDLSHY